MEEVPRDIGKLMAVLREGHPTIYVISRKLMALGCLLSSDCENEVHDFSDLDGLGHILKESSQDLHRIWSQLDPGNFYVRKDT